MIVRVISFAIGFLTFLSLLYFGSSLTQSIGMVPTSYRKRDEEELKEDDEDEEYHCDEEEEEDDDDGSFVTATEETEMQSLVEVDQCILADVDAMMDKSTNLLDEVIQRLKENSSWLDEKETFWRLAKAYKLKADFFNGKNKLRMMAECVNHGLEFATKALDVDASSPEAHRWYGILWGLKGQLNQVAHGVEGARKLYEHIIIAMRNSNDPSLRHTLGAFQFEISVLPYVSKMAIKWAWPEVPSATLDQALDNLEFGVAHCVPYSLENSFYRARCLAEMGRYKDAESVITAALKDEPKCCERALFRQCEDFRQTLRLR